MNSPKIEHYINDVSKVLSESVRHEANERLKNHDTQTTVQAIAYFFPHRQGRELLDIGLEIFNENGIGQKDTNNGLLLIVATEEKKLRIITGKGMEFEWNTEKCKYIVEQILRPLLNEEKYDEMVKAWCDCVTDVKKLEKMMSGGNLRFFRIIIDLFVMMFFIFGAYILAQTWLGSELAIYGNFSILVFFIYFIILYFPGILVIYRMRIKLFGEKKLGLKSLGRKIYFISNIAWFFILLIIILGTTYASFKQNFHIYKEKCFQLNICSSEDNNFEIWNKYAKINRQQRLIDYTREIEVREEDKRLHPEKYQYSSSDSDSSSSSSDSSFGGGGGSSNGGGYGD